MFRLLWLFVMALTAFAVDPEQMARIEAGLRPGMQVAGEPQTRWTLQERMAHHKVPALSIAVIHDGKLAWAKAYGVMDSSTKQPANTETLFQAASISKPVSALAALRLVAKGKLTLDEDVNARLSSWRVPQHSFAKPVTLRGLLSHTAGTTVHGFPGYAADAPVATAVQVLNGEKPANTSKVIVDIEPGSTWRYSGGGYTVMQVLVADVSKKPFAATVKELVLAPLQMNRSTFEQPLPESLSANAARAHGRDGLPIKGRWHTHPEQAAAGLWTTPSDLVKVLLAVRRAHAGETKLLPAAITRQMLTAGQDNYGLGWGVTGKDKNMSFGHGGSNVGFRCQARAYPERGQGAVIMTNGDNGGSLATEVLRSIAAEYGWPDYQVDTRTSISLSHEQLSAFTGNYTAANTSFEVSLAGKGITVKTGGTSHEFLPESENKFFSITEGPSLLVFEKDSEGKVTGFQADNIKATRKP